MELSNSSRNTHYGTILLYAEYSNLLTFSYKQQALKKNPTTFSVSANDISCGLINSLELPNHPYEPHSLRCSSKVHATVWVTNSGNMNLIGRSTQNDLRNKAEISNLSTCHIS